MKSRVTLITSDDDTLLAQNFFMTSEHTKEALFNLNCNATDAF